VVWQCDPHYGLVVSNRIPHLRGCFYPGTGGPVRPVPTPRLGIPHVIGSGAPAIALHQALDGNYTIDGLTQDRAPILAMTICFDSKICHD